MPEPALALVARFEAAVLHRMRRGLQRAAAIEGNPYDVAWWARGGLTAYRVGAAPELAWYQTIEGLDAARLPALEEALAGFRRGIEPRIALPATPDAAVERALRGRGFAPHSERALLFRATAGIEPPAPAGDAVRVVELMVDDDAAVYHEVLARGFELDHPVQAALTRCEHSGGDVRRFLAVLDGHPVAAGALLEHGGVAVLAGASTLPEWRGRGAQHALIASRLGASRASCEWAVVTTAIDSTSRRNLERAGFTLAGVTRYWCRTVPPGTGTLTT